MTQVGRFRIDWDDFKSTAADRFRDLIGKKDFSDVTLVSGDGQRIPSHQVILASGSSFFRTLLEEETTPKPLILMRGVDSNILEPLIRYSGPGAPALLRAEGQTASSLQKILLHDANKKRKSLMTLARSVGRPAAMTEWNRRTMFPIARHNGMATFSDAPKKDHHKSKK